MSSPSDSTSRQTATSVELKDETIELHSSTEDRLKAAWQVLQAADGSSAASR